MNRETVKVRMLQSVTYGNGPAWPAGSLQQIHPALARFMVRAGEAEQVKSTRTQRTR